MVFLVTRKGEWGKLKNSMTAGFEEKLKARQLVRHGQDLYLILLGPVG